jgi:hypothetical protein
MASRFASPSTLPRLRKWRGAGFFNVKPYPGLNDLGFGAEGPGIFMWTRVRPEITRGKERIFFYVRTVPYGYIIRAGVVSMNPRFITGENLLFFRGVQYEYSFFASDRH